MASLKRRADAVAADSHVSKKRARIVESTKSQKRASKAAATKSSSHDEIAAPSSRDELVTKEDSSQTSDEAGSLDATPVLQKKKSGTTGSNASQEQNGDKKFKPTSSAEAHATQRALAKERKAAKPNADLIGRSKKIWERLRIKSAVPLEERKALVEELYAIINGRVRDFVFKHDSVRAVQCALKYANKEQRLNITRELQADMRALAESKYGKFMVAKIVVEGDSEVRDLVIPEFYGHVRRMINHPEAAWIVDDIYRSVATPEQKMRMLREWYGTEFALDNKVKNDSLKKADTPTAELSKILEKMPEKRKPILNYLWQLINQLVQKKMTGFTMLHDAMLQYYLNTTPGSEEATEFLENLKSDLDEETGGGDLLKNLAFTKSGSRTVCLALAYGSAKDRKQILRVYKDVIEPMIQDAHAYKVLLAALEVTDDTRTTTKGIYPAMLYENVPDVSDRDERLMTVVTHLTARIPLLYPLAPDAKWLVPTDLAALLKEVYAIRSSTSKKDPAVRHAELAKYVASSLLELASRRTSDLIGSTPGCQALTEILLACPAHVDEDLSSKAVDAAVSQCTGDAADGQHITHNSGAGKMLRTLCQGGHFDPKTKAVTKAEKSTGFAQKLFELIKKESQILTWATGPSSFVIVAMAEGDELETGSKKDLLATLKKGKKQLEKAAEANGKEKGNAGARILLEKL